MKNVGSDVGRAVGAGVGTVDGTADGTAVNIVGADVSSSRRAPSRRPLDRRAFGPLRRGRCPTTTALRNKLQHHRQAIIMNDGSPSSTIWDELRQPPPRFALGSGACRIPGLPATGRPVPRVSLVRRRAPRGPPELSLSSSKKPYGTILTVPYCGRHRQETRAGTCKRRVPQYKLVPCFLCAGSQGSTTAFCCSTDSVQPKH